jgi:hypothetical protein
VLVEDPGPETLPLPEGVAHVPSPLRKVVEFGVPETAPTAVTEDSRLPLVGRVTVVAPVAVNVVPKAPEVVNDPPRITDFPPIELTAVVVEPAEVVISPENAGNTPEAKYPEPFV